MDIVRFSKERRDELQEWINRYWKEGHSLSKSSMLLDFQHFNKQDECYDFYLLEDNNEVWGLIGYIPLFQFDCSLRDENEGWGGIWKVRDDCPIKGLGLDLFDKLLSEFGNKGSFGAIGMSRMAYKLFKVYKLEMGQLNQYYVGNPYIKDFKVCKNIVSNKIEPNQCTNWTIEVLYNLESIDTIQSSYRPKKTIQFFTNRYTNHPIYKYFFWVIYKKSEPISVWALRRITVGTSSILRIVDIIGNIESLPALGSCIQEEVIKEAVEYVDLLNYGIDSSIFERIGFIKHNISDEDIIVPNYFEPFEMRNVSLDFAYRSQYANYVLFKADSDQDRPNIL